MIYTIKYHIMNHIIVYENLINKAKREKRKKYKGVYYEKHHIVPKCLGGSNDKSNLVLLTAKEHFIAHKLLMKIYPNVVGLIYAHYAMAYFPSRYRKHNLRISAKEFEEIKNMFINIKRPSPYNKGKIGLYHASDETKKKISIKSSGKNNGMYGKVHSDKTKKKISNANYGEKNGLKRKVKEDPNFIKGENNHRSKTYKITTPDNVILIVKGLRNFCKQNKLHHSNMIKVSNGSQDNHKGFKCERL